jgi:hypothetical protein
MDVVFVARPPVMELLEKNGLDAVKEKMLEILGKAVAVPREARRPVQ